MRTSKSRIERLLKFESSSIERSLHLVSRMSNSSYDFLVFNKIIYQVAVVFLGLMLVVSCKSIFGFKKIKLFVFFHFKIG